MSQIRETRAHPPERTPPAPSDADRLWRGLTLESGDALPPPPRPVRH